MTIDGHRRLYRLNIGGALVNALLISCLVPFMRPELRLPLMKIFGVNVLCFMLGAVASTVVAHHRAVAIAEARRRAAVEALRP